MWKVWTLSWLVFVKLVNDVFAVYPSRDSRVIIWFKRCLHSCSYRAFTARYKPPVTFIRVSDQTLQIMGDFEGFSSNRLLWSGETKNQNLMDWPRSKAWREQYNSQKSRFDHLFSTDQVRCVFCDTLDTDRLLVDGWLLCSHVDPCAHHLIGSKGLKRECEEKVVNTSCRIIFPSSVTDILSLSNFEDHMIHMKLIIIWA